METLAKPHTKLAIILICIYIIDNVVGFLGRCYNIYQTKKGWLKFLAAPFPQIYALTLFPWKKSNEVTKITDDDVSQIGKHIKIDIDEGRLG